MTKITLEKDFEYDTQITLTEKQLDLLCRYMRFAHLSNAYPCDSIAMHIQDNDLLVSTALLKELDYQLRLIRS